MKYILNKDIALRSWQLVPFAYYKYGIRRAQKLSSDDFLLLMTCNGKHCFMAKDNAALMSEFT